MGRGLCTGGPSFAQQGGNKPDLPSLQLLHEWPGSGCTRSVTTKEASNNINLFPLFTQLTEILGDIINKEYFISKFYFFFKKKCTNKEKLKKAR